MSVSKRRVITPPAPPKPGDRIEVRHTYEWKAAVVTRVEDGYVMGELESSYGNSNPARRVLFSYPIDAYREDWRFL